MALPAGIKGVKEVAEMDRDRAFLEAYKQAPESGEILTLETLDRLLGFRKSL